VPPSLTHQGAKPPPLENLEWEVLPPEDRHRRKGVESLFRWLALIMDDLLRLPGTKFRFGLDPLIGLVPGIGDTTSAITSALVLLQAARNGLPKVLLARMAGNILINEVIGIVPGLGDAFSFWFKSNKRNYELLRQHLDTPRRSTTGDKIFVGALIGLVLLTILLGMVATFWIFHEIAKMIANG
jgi:hypothetical protein